MLVIANNLLRDNKFGMMFRVSVGAFLSTVDAATDIFVISTYYNDGLHGKANAMLAMITSNMVGQLLIVLAQYKKKSWQVKAKEMLISLFFLRPAVDAFRVSTNHKDKEANADPLTEMVCNKVSVAAGSFVNTIY